ncbi:MAG TPA: hypothetical protein VLM79_10385 [Kofleriaceae bacterium]|nr:hypothetical protein [Kofleriaceae bacterium]
MTASMTAAVVVVATVACAHGAAQAPLANQADGAHGAASEVRGIDWQNRTYVLDELGPVAVKDGEGALQTGDAGGGSYSVARPVFADVNGDGVEDAIISSVMSTGGTGRFSDVRVYTMRAGKVAELAMIPGGDRGDGGIRRVAVDGGAVIVERNVLAEGDGACCASQARRERWVWRNGEIVEDESARRAFPANP